MAANKLRGIRILLVEDEIMIALEIAEALKQEGADVAGPFLTLDAAMAAAQTEAIDLAILDIDLRGEEVFPAAELLRARGIPFLFYTGRPDREQLRGPFATVPVCIKPLPTPKLLEALSKLLPIAA